MTTPSSFSEVIDLWPSIAELARDIGEPYETVRQWRLRDSVPARALDKIKRAAGLRGFDLSADVLMRIAAQRGAA
jgi:hypothetical protein